MRRRARRISVAAVGLGVAAAPFVVLFALPAVGVGHWPEAEPVIAALHATGALVAAGLAVAILCGDGRAVRAVAHPFVLVFAGLAAWSAVASLFHALPGLTWAGSPQLGEGVLGAIDLAVLVAGAILVRRLRPWRRAITAAALIATLAAVGLGAFPFEIDGVAWRLYTFRDHYAFQGLFLVAILVTFGGMRGRLALAVAILAGIVVVVASANRTATVLVVPALIFAACLWHLGGRVRPAMLAAAVAGVALAGLAALAIGGAAGLYPDSVGIRASVIDAAFTALSSDPSRYAVGTGWGGFSDLLIAGMTPAHIATGVLQGDTNRVFFHSHNVFAESLFAAGVPGLALALAIHALLPVFGAPRDRVLAATIALSAVALGSLWFQLTASLPLMAVAWAGLADGRPAFGRRWRALALRRVRPLAVAGLAASALVLLLASGATWRRAAHATSFAPTLAARHLGVALDTCPDLLADFSGGGIHLAIMYRSHGAALARLLAQGRSVPDADIAGLAWYFCAADRAMAEGAVLELRNVDLLVRSDFAFLALPPRLRRVVAPRLASWEARLSAFLERAPGRTDQAVPYLTWRLAARDTASVKRVTDAILRRAPLDPVALWFSGATLLGAPETAADGSHRMRRALEVGLERVMPVDPTLKRQLSAGG